MSLGEANSQNGLLQFVAKHHQNLKWIVYALLVLNFGYYVYTWDILLWIGGFAAIDANLAQWRDELEDESETEKIM